MRRLSGNGGGNGGGNGRSAAAKRPRFNARKRVRRLDEPLSVGDVLGVATRNEPLTDDAMERIEKAVAGNAAFKEASTARVRELLSGEKQRAKGEPDIGTQERAQHDEVVIEGTGTRHARVTTQHVLDRYLRRKEIDNRQHLAGLRALTLFQQTGLTPQVTARLDAVPGGAAPWDDRVTERAALARIEWGEVMRALGARLSPVIVHVCCLGEPAGEWARARGYAKPEDGLIVLRIALDTLGDYWRLT